MALHLTPALIRLSRTVVLPLLLSGALAGCGWFGGNDQGSVKPIAGASLDDPTAPAITPGTRQGNLRQEDSNALQVNKYLWRGALETLGFMPFASADPFGGVIVTDWYAPPAANGERFKVTVYVLGRELRSDGVKLSIFRQVRQGDEWVDAQVNPSMAIDIEGKILARARELRAAAFYK